MEVEITDPKEAESLLEPPSAPEPPAAKPKSSTKKSKKPAGPGTAKSLNKTYLQLSAEALIALKNRNGSSLAAIKKWILIQYPDLFGPHFNTRVNQALKKGVESGKLIKIKASFKLNKVSTLKSPPKESKKLHELAERIKRRRYPMEDTKLHQEDKLLGVQPPKLPPKPNLPYFWQQHERPSGKTPTVILANSKADSLDVGSRGLVSDLLSVYHFFQGDVSFEYGSVDIVPEFSLAHLKVAVEQIWNGNARRSRTIPPLIVHLFCTCLQILLRRTDSPDRKVTQLHQDLEKFLLPALTPVSWSDVTFLYMDAMERFYSSDASENPAVLPSLPADAAYILGLAETPQSGDDTKAGYYAYLGDPKGTMYRAHHKLQKYDPWMLTAEELLTLLRALTEDCLALKPEMMDDREEQLAELAKQKRSADAKYRKVKLAFEGPKGETNFKPTASKKAYENAQRAQEKAHAEYRQGLEDLVSRTVPIGHDRNFSGVYCFRHDPQVLYVEEQRPPPTAPGIPTDLQFPRCFWYTIPNTSTFDKFVASLDVRGRRELNLKEALVGESPEDSFRVDLYDDVKEQQEQRTKARERNSLEAKLKNAQRKCDDDQGRRSGRLVGQAEDELIQVQSEMNAIADEGPKKEEKVENYERLTGLTLLREFESSSRFEARRTRDRKEVAVRRLPVLHCSRVVNSGKKDGSGLVRILVSSLLDLEKHCESLETWGRLDVNRAQWIAKLEGMATLWNSGCPNILGPSTLFSPEKKEKRDSLDSVASGTPNKRRRHNEPSTPTSDSSVKVSTVLGPLKTALLDLEERVAQITNVALATRDAELADENMSVDSAADQEKLESQSRAWKRLVYKIGNTPTRKAVRIRELIVAAISEARKAHLSDVVAALRAALLKYHPSSAVECKKSALEVLKDHGGYELDDEDDENDEDKADDIPEVIPSVVPHEAAVYRSSLDGSDDAHRQDWINLVRSVKTLSRLSSVIAAFVEDAMQKIEKLQIERDELTSALQAWTRSQNMIKRVGKGRKKGSAASKDLPGPSEVWASVTHTDEFCMAKAEDYPWWPAKKCIAKDPKVAESLSNLDRSLVAFVGEMGGLRVVKNEDLQPFTGVLVADPTEYSKELCTTLDECMAMARRIRRGLQKKQL